MAAAMQLQSRAPGPLACSWRNQGGVTSRQATTFPFPSLQSTGHWSISMASWSSLRLALRMTDDWREAFFHSFLHFLCQHALIALHLLPRRAAQSYASRQRLQQGTVHAACLLLSISQSSIICLVARPCLDHLQISSFFTLSPSHQFLAARMKH